MNNRGRYPPGIGAGRGGGVNANPSFQSRPHQQQYVQRNLVPNQQYQQQHHQNQHQHQQLQQHQQWLKRNQLGGGPADSNVDEVEKTVQSEAVDSRFVLNTRRSLCFFLCIILYGHLHIMIGLISLYAHTGG